MPEKKYTGRQMIGAVILTLVLALTGGLITLFALLGHDGMAVAEGFALTRLLFVGEADLKTAADDALFTMVDYTGDRWTYYLDEDWNKSNQMYIANQTKGIGVRIIAMEDGLLVADVVPDGGADQAGIRKGEYFVAVEGMSLCGEDGWTNKNLIGGEAGTEVTLTVRNDRGEEREVRVLRGTWFDPPARGSMLQGEIGYVRLFNFNDGSKDAFCAEVEALLKEGATGLIFDMRQNGGGYVTELTEILDYLLPEGVVFRQKTSWGWSFKKKSDASCVDLPMAVLVDENSFSAAELFAAQLQESVGAYIVGEHTSGKGYFQYPFPLSNGGSLSLSIGTYTTGNGTSLSGVGLEPDKIVSLTDEEDAWLAARWLSAEEDPVLLEALWHLLGV